MAASCNRNTWQTISGVFVNRPKEIIKEEINRNEERFRKGLGFYKKPSSGSLDKLKKEQNIQGPQLDFALKLSKFLRLDEGETYNVFFSYILHDYRGSQRDLKTLLGSERHCQALMVKVRDYYNTERLYLLRCVKQLLSYWQEDNHPYMEQYAQFVEKNCDDNSFIQDIISQYESICKEPAPTWETHGNAMNERQATLWMVQNLKEQCELLEIILLFYRSFQNPPETMVKFMTMFKKQNFGKRQTNRHLVDDSMDVLIRRISYLQTIVLIEGLDLEFLLKAAQNNSLHEHHIIKSVKNFKALDELICTLGDNAAHGPIILAWTTLRELLPDTAGTLETRRLGKTAVQLGIYPWLQRLLATEPFNGKTTVASSSQYIIYSLLHMVLFVFQESTLGDRQALYATVAKLISQPNTADDFHEAFQEGHGVGSLLQTACQRFPLEVENLCWLLSAYAQASKGSAQNVCKLLSNMTMYTELLDHNKETAITGTPEEDVFELVVDKRPYSGCNFTIPRGTRGRIVSSEGDTMVIQWDCYVNGFQVLHGELMQLLRQVAHGVGMVSASSIKSATAIINLIQSVLASDISTYSHMKLIAPLLPQLIQRFSLFTSPPLDLLAGCISIFASLSSTNPTEVWNNFQQTGFSPYMTENFDNLAEAVSGAGLNSGRYGTILAGSECTDGKYPVTVAFLDLIAGLIRPLHKANALDSVMAPVVYVCREIFPVFHRWRYYDFSRREQVGQKCLEIFHRILNIFGKEEGKGVTVRSVCIHCLLYTESGRALLDVVSTGVDNIEVALAQQGSATEGVGVELIQLVRLGFSVLNRLLMLRESDGPPSPVEHALSARPANYTHRHVVAVIAQYIYHRHDPRLSTLSTLLLKRLAMVFPMSILACLGNESEPIRDMYLSRLQAHTEDVRLKVVILELLAVCVETQPGLTEMFLNVQKSKDSKMEMNINQTSCLQTALNLIAEKKQGTYQCPSDLLCAALVFLHSLWWGGRETAMSALREQESFWPSVCLSLMRDLSQPSEKVQQDVLDQEIKTCANIMRIIAHELYCVQSYKLDDNFKKVLKEILVESRLQYWSTYLRNNLIQCGALTEVPTEVLSECSSFQLLLAWRNLSIVTSSHKPTCFDPSQSTKAQILDDLLAGLEAQFQNSMTLMHTKLAAIASALYFTLVKKWAKSLKDTKKVLEQLEKILNLTCANSETLLPSVQIGLIASVTAIVHFKSTPPNTLDAEKSSLESLVSVACSVLQQSTYQLPAPQKKNAQNNGEDKVTEVKLKLQVVCICMLEELIRNLDRPQTWLSVMQHHLIIPSLLASLPTWIVAQQGQQYVEAMMTLMLTLARIPPAAEALATNRINQHLCLPLVSLYDNQVMGTPGQTQPVKSTTSSWMKVYCQSVDLMTVLLRTLRYNFLQETLDFVGVHQDRMLQCLQSVRLNLAEASLEEVSSTAKFLCELSNYRREWRLHLPGVLNILMTALCFLCQTCVGLLIRPRLLQHILQKPGTGEKRDIRQDRSAMTPVTRRLSTQSSTDESDSFPEMYTGQQRLLEILVPSFTALRLFCPELCPVLLDQSLDISEYDPLIGLGFGTPSVEQETPPTFGMLTSCMNMCLRLLNKLDPRSTSPMKSPTGDIPVKKDTVMYVLEMATYLMMSQSVRYLRETNLATRDKQLLKRELSAELNSFLIAMQRHFRRGPQSPASGSTIPLTSPQMLSGRSAASHTAAASPYPDQAYFKFIDNFLRNVLK